MRTIQPIVDLFLFNRCQDILFPRPKLINPRVDLKTDYGNEMIRCDVNDGNKSNRVNLDTNDIPNDKVTVDCLTGGTV